MHAYSLRRLLSGVIPSEDAYTPLPLYLLHACMRVQVHVLGHELACSLCMRACGRSYLIGACGRSYLIGTRDQVG